MIRLDSVSKVYRRGGADFSAVRELDCTIAAIALGCMGLTVATSDYTSESGSEPPRDGEPAGQPGIEPPREVAFAGQIAPIFDTACAKCHGGSGNFPDLRGVRARASLLERKLVVPGQADASRLVKKIRDGHPWPRALTPHQIALIEAWVAEGALAEAQTGKADRAGQPDREQAPRATP